MKIQILSVLSPLSVILCSTKSAQAWVPVSPLPAGGGDPFHHHHQNRAHKRTRPSSSADNTHNNGGDLTKASYSTSAEIVEEERVAAAPATVSLNLLKQKRNALSSQKPKQTVSLYSNSKANKGGTKKGSSSSFSSYSSSSSKAGLTREEEIAYSFQIRTFRTVMRLRSQLQDEKHCQRLTTQQQQQFVTGSTDSFRTIAVTTTTTLTPRALSDTGVSSSSAAALVISDPEWAAACGISVKQLRRILERGQAARHALIAANTGLVTNIAKRHYFALKQATQAGGGVGTILGLSDMIQEGNLGLMKAAERYQPEKGFRFSTYATFWIRQRILRSISDESRIIRLPAHVHSTLGKIQKTKALLQKQRVASGQRGEPSLEELAVECNLTVEQLKLYQQSSRNVVSLEKPLRTSASGSSFKEDSRTIADVVASDALTPEEEAQQNYLKRDVRQLLQQCLQPHERTVLMERFGLDHGHPRTVAETAKRLGWSRDRVRLVEARAMNKLRSPQRNYRLKEYVGTTSSNSGSGSTAATDSTMMVSSSKTKASSSPSPSSLFSDGGEFSASTFESMMFPSSFSTMNTPSTWSSSSSRAQATTASVDASSIFDQCYSSSSSPSSSAANTDDTASSSNSRATLANGGRIWFF